AERRVRHDRDRPTRPSGECLREDDGWEGALSHGSDHGPIGPGEVNSRRSVFCFGPFDLCPQAELNRALRTDTPKHPVVWLGGATQGLRPVFPTATMAGEWPSAP